MSVRLSVWLLGVEPEADHWQPRHVDDRREHRRELACCQGNRHYQPISQSINQCKDNHLQKRPVVYKIEIWIKLIV